MSKQQPIDLMLREMGIGTLRSIEEQVSCGGFQKIGVGIKRPARKNFELVHGCVSRML
jgi:hypothetical protein